MDDPTSPRAELKRYIVRRRRSGIDVIHRLDHPLEEVHTGDGGGGRGSGGEVRARAAERADGEKRKETGVSRPKDSGAEVKRCIEIGEHSITYRDEPRVSSQASLFSSGERRVAEPDVSGLDLVSLEEMVSTCTRCPLCETRNRTVFGAGAPDARIVFIGEAPGREEDIQGIPFVGRAGKLLTKILASVGMTREEVYITNILKCRPPENRDPQEDEVRACSIFFRRQIELINPALICALGRVAGQNLLHCNTSLSVLRQNIHLYNDTKVVVTYHPAALLRNPNLKRAAWDDIKMVRSMYDEAPVREQRGP